MSLPMPEFSTDQDNRRGKLLRFWSLSPRARVGERLSGAHHRTRKLDASEDEAGWEAAKEGDDLAARYA